MLDKIIDMINERGYAQDIGQIDKATKKKLESLVRKGILRKSREPWAMMTVLKTTYRAA